MNSTDVRFVGACEWADVEADVMAQYEALSGAPTASAAPAVVARHRHCGGCRR